MSAKKYKTRQANDDPIIVVKEEDEFLKYPIEEELKEYFKQKKISDTVGIFYGKGFRTVDTFGTLKSE
jgi:ribosomal protein L3